MILVDDSIALPARIEAAAAAHFAIPLHVAVDLTGPGTGALARALAAAGRSSATGVTAWPCPYASLTHSGDVSVAVALPANVSAEGIGIDLEFDRPVRAGFARMVCSDHELAWLDTLSAETQAAEVLRLWTIKEALYKADPDQGDAIVAHYAVTDPGGERTTGRRIGRDDSANVFSMRIAGGILSMAMRAGRAPDPATDAGPDAASEERGVT